MYLNKILYILLFSQIIFVSCNKEKYTYDVKYIDVPVDHFSFTRNDTFKLRYLINSTHWDNDKGPILFYTGNEGDIELFAENTGFVWELGETLKGLVIFAEHRFYGESMPFGNTSYSKPEHLGYLSSLQALGDFADLLTHINKPKSGSKNSSKTYPVIAFGGSYGGMLAAWFRMKYPHLVNGAIASSAPVLQFTGITPCEVFNRIVTSDFDTAIPKNKNCTANIRNSWGVLKNLSATSEGLSWLTNELKLCSPLKNYDEIEDFLTEIYGNLAMANYPYPADFLAPMPAYPIREFCYRLKDTSTGTDLIKNLTAALSIYTNYTGKVGCLDIGSHATPKLGETGWDFQACTEMVMPMCSNGKEDMFSVNKWDIKKYSDDCFKKFGVRPRVNAATTLYGGEQLSAASNIVFSNGLLDPWSGGGILRSAGPTVLAVIIPEGAHHLDLRASNDLDPASVVQARLFHTQAIQKWINDHWNTKSYRHRTI